MGKGEGFGGRSETENDFRFLPFNPGDFARTLEAEGRPLRVAIDGPVRRVAKEFCSVMGKSL